MQSTGSRAGGGFSRAFCKCVSARRDLRCGTFSYRVVCGIAHDADPDYSRHSHEPDSVRPIARQLSTYNHDIVDHGNRSIPAVLAARRVFGICPAANSLLAIFAAHVDLLSRSNPNCEGLAAEEVVDLIIAARLASGRRFLLYPSVNRSVTRSVTRRRRCDSDLG